MVKRLPRIDEMEDSGRVELDDNKIAYYKQLWNNLHEKYRNQGIWKNMWQTAQDKKSLTRKQFAELDYLLRNGKTQYESGILSTKH